MPSFVSITDAKTHDSRMSRRNLPSNPAPSWPRTGDTWTSASFARRSGVFFVTRMKDNPRSFRGQSPAPAENGHKSFPTRLSVLPNGMEEKYPEPLRRINAENPETGENIVLLTNHLRFAASTIGEIYRDSVGDRALLQDAEAEPEGQNLRRRERERPFIQIWTALISLLVIKWL